VSEWGHDAGGGDLHQAGLDLMRRRWWGLWSPGWFSFGMTDWQCDRGPGPLAVPDESVLTFRADDALPMPPELLAYFRAHNPPRY
jgi:hypothetical protein